MAETGKYAELRAAVDAVAVVDAHARRIVAEGSPFQLPAGETLADKRSLREIAKLHGTEASLDKVEEHRKSEGLLSISSKCFSEANISAVIFHDGLASDKTHDLEWHKSLVPTVARILVIEDVADDIVNDMSNGSTKTFDSFTEIFLRNIRPSAGVAALKSTASFRSGLEINPNVSKLDAEKGFQQELTTTKPIRITNKNLVDYLFTLSLEVAKSFDLPVQIDTGFGDRSSDLRKCNPLHLRSVLDNQRFSSSRFVLLHASYPFSREASYLASVYPQVYLDYSTVLPKLSTQGIIASFKALLDLAPLKKVMFSSDGYGFPENFYLGAKKARDVVFHVLSNACEDGDLTIPEAIEAAEGFLRKNALELYKLNNVAEPVKLEKSKASGSSRTSINAKEDVLFVRIIWIDASGQHRCRVVPAKRFYTVVKNTGVGLTHASMGMSSFADGPADGTNLTGVGEIRLVPDLPTIRRLQWSAQEEMVLADMHVKPGEAWEYCPRSALKKVTKVLNDEFNVVLKAGFENEFYLLKKGVSTEGREQWVPFDSTPYCSTSGFDAASSILKEIYAALEHTDIEVEQLHAEAGKGQFEIALKYGLCTVSADNVAYAREVIRAVARKHELLATFLPKYDMYDIGSGNHVHLSLWENEKNVFMGSTESHRHGMSKLGEGFLAGVYHHLPAILAFTAPHPNSYQRIQPDTWSGAYHCWGKENREAPLRTACPPGIPLELVSNFEIKSFDACANPHLGLAAIAAAGIDGLRRSLTLPEPVETNPSELASTLQRLPKDLQESVEALSADKLFSDLIGEKIVTAVIAIRKAESDYYEKKPWAMKELIHRY